MSWELEQIPDYCTVALLTWKLLIPSSGPSFIFSGKKRHAGHGTYPR